MTTIPDQFRGRPLDRLTLDELVDLYKSGDQCRTFLKTLLTDAGLAGLLDLLPGYIAKQQLEALIQKEKRSRAEMARNLCYAESTVLSLALAHGYPNALALADELPAVRVFLDDALAAKGNTETQKILAQLDERVRELAKIGITSADYNGFALGGFGMIDRLTNPLDYSLNQLIHLYETEAKEFGLWLRDYDLVESVGRAIEASRTIRRNSQVYQMRLEMNDLKRALAERETPPNLLAELEGLNLNGAKIEVITDDKISEALQKVYNIRRAAE